MIRTYLVAAGLSLGLGCPLFAQDGGMMPLDDLSAFANPDANWQIAGDVQADISQDNVLSASPGTGILVNLPTSRGATDLYTAFVHQDADIELEFMMARHSNSGIYLQGQYEIQLLDSHGKPAVYFGDCGGIYQRWDESRGSGKEGYEGNAPRVNACKAPGLWQHLAISFRAARFSPGGEKIEHAKILSVHLNGQLLHQNVTLTGPTRGSDHPYDIAKGPLRIQGDHGPVAFRNIKINSFDAPPITHNNLVWEMYTGEFDQIPDFNTLSAAASGTMERLTSEVVDESEDFILRVQGMMEFPRDGEYAFALNTLGNGQLFVNGEEVIPYGWWNQMGMTEIIAGQHPVELIYHKRDSWYNNGLSLNISGPGLRSQPIHVMSSMPLGNPVSPIYVDANGAEPSMMRCFIDYRDAYGTRRIPHAISVGNQSGMHFTFDPDRAALAQGWKGKFLDATPMWNNRGDGSSRPRGAVQAFGDEAGIAVDAGSETAWPAEVPESLAYQYAGYSRDPHQAGEPIFIYEIGDATLHDHWSGHQPGQLDRQLTIEGPIPGGTQLRMASGATIREVSGESGFTTYEVDQAYYVKVPAGTTASVVPRGDQKILVADISGTPGELSYSLVW